MPTSAKQAHRTLAAFLLVFVAVHFAAHLAGTVGVAMQAAVRDTTRAVYQSALVEALLILGFAAQIVLGGILLRQIARRRRKGGWHWVQFFSGAYLALFIINHTAAAVITRIVVGLDTNFYWAAGSLAFAPLGYGFAIYYVLAVTALFGHIVAALHFRGARRWHAPALFVGPVIGAAIVATYGGALYPIELPHDYIDYYLAFPGTAS